MILWADKPFGRALICFILGILVAKYFPWSNLIIIVPTILLLVIYIYRERYIKYKSPYIQGALVLSIMLFAGYNRYMSVLPSMNTKHFMHQIKSKHQYLHGQVKSIPKATTRISFNIEVEGISSTADSLRSCNGLITAYFDKDDAAAMTYEPGDEIILHGYAKALRSSRNPNAFDFNDYLRTKHIYYRIEVDPDMHVRTGKKLDSWIARIATSIRTYAINCFNSKLSNDDNRGLAAAMILGHRNGISNELYNSYTKTGAVHVLAVSGLHVGIVCSILFFLFRIFLRDENKHKLLRVLLIAAFVMMYCLITGASAAVLRASIMVIIFFIARYWANTANTFNVLSLAAFTLLLYDPKMLFQASFQFSFLALTSIVYFFDPFYRLLQVKNKFGDRIWQLICLSLSAQILVTPLTIYYFHRFPIYFWLSGIVAVPAAYIILATGILLLVVSLFSEKLSDLIAYCLDLMFDLFVHCIRLIENLPKATLENLWIYKHELLIIYGSIISLMIGYSWKKPNYLLVGAIGFPLYMLSCMYYQQKSKNQSGLTVYDYYKGYLIDIYSGNNCYVVKSNDMPARSETFITQNQRIYKKAEVIESIQLDSSFINSDVAYRNRVLQVGETSVYFIDSTYQYTVNPIDVDIAILLDPKYKKQSELIQNIHADKWIITQNPKYYKQNEWKSLSEENPEDYILINSAGAYSTNLNMHQ